MLRYHTVGTTLHEKNEVEESEESVLPPWEAELEQGVREPIEPHS